MAKPSWRSPPPDWQMPRGVDRGLWDYLHSNTVADNYDAGLTQSLLFSQDVAFVQKHVSEPGLLLDLGCGTGRLAQAMVDLGHRVVGVDLSETMLHAAHTKFTATADSVMFLKANITQLECLADGRFDSVACLFSTLGMVRGRDNRRRVLDHVHRVLRPGGLFCLHVHNRWFGLYDRAGRRALLGDCLSLFGGAHEPGDRLMPTHQGVANLTLHLFTRREVTRLLRSVGFRIREVLPLDLTHEEGLSSPWWFGRLRAYGYLIAAEKNLHPGGGSSTRGRGG